MSRTRLALALALLLSCEGAEGGAPSFDGDRAFADLEAQVLVGPRPAGSEGARATRELIRGRLLQAGWPVAEQQVSVLRPDGRRVELVNLRASLPGERRESIWLGAHYDTKAFPDFAFVGANDGASGVAVLLELARALGRRVRPFTIELVFFDGEEAFGAGITESDGLYGSKAAVAELERSGELAQLRVLLLVDMVADRDLNLTVDRTSAPWLLEILRREAARIDPELMDGRSSVTLVDDHTPFQRAGARDVLAIIDFQFGARRTPGPLWHTAGDDLRAVSAESLNSVGRLVVQILERVEERLIQRASGDSGR